MKTTVSSRFLCAVASARAGRSRAATTNEWSLNLFVVGSNHYTFEGGASARNDGGAGFGFSVARNLNDYFAVGVESTLASSTTARASHRAAATAAPASRPAATWKARRCALYATWNLLARPLTPFVTAAAGVIFLDPDLGADPPANACWAYPWYGQVCGAQAPSNTLTRFSYGAGAGLRFDLPGERGFIRAFVGGEWIEMSEALSTVGYVTVRADFGLRF